MKPAIYVRINRRLFSFLQANSAWSIFCCRFTTQGSAAMYDQTKKSSAVHNICKFMSIKNHSVVRTMSILEYDFCFHAEYNPNVASYASQPEGFFYPFNGRDCRYTPDFELFSNDGSSVLVEVKHSSQITKVNFRARFAEKQRVALENYGKQLILVTEKQIRSNFLLGNLKLLHAYSGLRTITSIQKSVLGFIQQRQKVQIMEIVANLGISIDQAKTAVFCWLASGDINADLEFNIGVESHVWC